MDEHESHLKRQMHDRQLALSRLPKDYEESQSLLDDDLKRGIITEAHYHYWLGRLAAGYHTARIEMGEDTDG